MSDTHINAYFADVDEKLKAVLAAQSELEAAKARLEDKKRAVNWVDESAEPEQNQKAEEKSEPEQNQGRNNQFSKRR